MFRMVSRESRMALGTSESSLRVRIRSADSMAMSLPLPMAQPTSAWTRAGASLMPSPTIMTFRPWAWSFWTTPAFSSGSTSAMTWSTPTSCPMRSAAALWSPVSSTVRMPWAFRSAMAWALSGFTGSATLTRPSSFPSRAKNMGVWPWPARASASAFTAARSMPFSAISRSLPARMTLPATVARRPRPERFSKLSGAGGVSSPRFPASAVMALASGCWETASTPAARVKSSASETPAGRTAATAGEPSVTVPVLSSTTVSVAWVISRASPLRIRMPWEAPSPVPTMMAVGVARPRAQGQAMTRTEVKTRRAKGKSCPSSSQRMAARAAMLITTGTKTPATLSATLAMGAFFPWASSTKRMMRERVESSPTSVTRT